MGHWQAGDPILLRELYRGRVWAARPVRVVEDTDERVAVYMAPGTRWKRPVSPDGEPLRLQSEKWELADAVWEGNAALRVFVASRSHSVLTWWDPVRWEFQGWYVNLEQPMRRTTLGFDYLDQVLDIVVAPDRTWRWKDEDEFALAQETGLFTPTLARRIRAEGERVIEDLEANRPPFSEGWEQWRPDPDWDPPPLPPGWDVVADPGRTDQPPDGGSAQRSRAFYRRLGPTGLAIRTRPEWDAQILRALLELMPSGGAVLDVGCGYGRIAIPLAERGYRVTGFDISPNLLRAARREATRRRVTVRFDEGSMTSLPYPAASFDVVLSLWTAFYELVEEAEQVAALREMSRVLRPGGIGIIEGPAYTPPTEAEVATGVRHGPGHRISVAIIAGERLEHFAHDASSLERVADAAGIAQREVVVRDWAGRERQLLLFHR